MLSSSFLLYEIRLLQLSYHYEGQLCPSAERLILNTCHATRKTISLTVNGLNVSHMFVRVTHFMHNFICVLVALWCDHIFPAKSKSKQIKSDLPSIDTNYEAFENVRLIEIVHITAYRQAILNCMNPIPSRFRQRKLKHNPHVFRPFNVKLSVVNRNYCPRGRYHFLNVGYFVISVRRKQNTTLKQESNSKGKVIEKQKLVGES